MIVIVDYGMGNLGSVLNMLKKIRVEAVISSDPSVIGKAFKLILPGVGAFDNGMKNLEERGLIPLLEEKVIKQKVLILGVCLGMQLFTKKSEEGKSAGLGWIDAHVVRFNFEHSIGKLRVPHMGWNTIEIVQEHRLFKDMFEEERFYFVHSYHVKCNNNSNILSLTKYGYNFPSSIIKENIIGVQFHPEKSHKFGMKLLKNFVEFC